MTDLLVDFQNTKIFKQLISDPNLVVMYVSGSRILGYSDDLSDYDIEIIYEKECRDEFLDNLSLQKDEINIHWYRWSLREFLGYSTASQGTVMFNRFSVDNIIYLNPSKKYYLDLMLKYQKDIVELAQHRLYETYSWKLKQIVEKESLSLADFQKYVYRHIILANDYLNRPEDKELATTVKLAMKKQINLKERKRVQNLFKEFIDTIESDDYDIKKEEDRLFTIFNIERAT